MIKPGTPCKIQCCGNMIPVHFNGKIVTVVGSEVLLGVPILMVAAHWMSVSPNGCFRECLRPLIGPDLLVDEEKISTPLSDIRKAAPEVRKYVDPNSIPVEYRVDQEAPYAG